VWQTPVDVLLALLLSTARGFAPSAEFVMSNTIFADHSVGDVERVMAKIATPRQVPDATSKSQRSPALRWQLMP